MSLLLKMDVYFQNIALAASRTSHLSPGKEEPGQHMRTDINTSLELHISRGSSEGKLGSMPCKELPHRVLPFRMSPRLCSVHTAMRAKAFSVLFLPVTDSAISLVSELIHRAWSSLK